MRRIRKVALTLVLASILLIANMPLHVKAATTPPTVDDAYILSRLSELAGLLGINEGNLDEGDGVYFTVNQQKCGTGLGGHGCDNCKNTNVANAEWFKNIFGTVNTGGFPKQYKEDGAAGSPIGWSCWGFAAFVMWYAASSQNTDDIVGTLVATSTFTKENILSLCKPGDIIRSNGHSMVFISADEDTMKVMDSNWRTGEDATNCRVRIREFGYSESEFTYFKGKAMGITRAGNYDPNGSDTTPPIVSNIGIREKDNTGYTIYCDVIDDGGVAKVCFAIWTEANGQDDLDPNWQETQAVYAPISGNTYAFRVNLSEHNGEDGVYCTEIYAYDIVGNHSVEEITVTAAMTEQEKQLRAFVERMYTVALGRTAEVEGLNYYTDRLLSGDSNGACLAESFLCSPEFVNKGYDDAQYVDILYKTFFDREPAAEEVNYWVGKLTSGESKTFVLSGFVNSVEFDNLCASDGISRGFMREDGKPLNPGIGRFAERLYTVVLERAGEKEGIEYWSLNMANGTCTPKDAAKSFFLSQEYINKNTSDAQYITTLYRTFMDREPEAGGVEYWQNVLNNGATREQILEGFADSAEFKGIMASFGL